MAGNRVRRRPVSSVGFGSFHHSKKNPLNAITKQVRDLIKPYEKSRFIPAWQSVVDSTNLWYTSCCNLYFSYRDAYNQSSTILDPQAFQLSNREFHDFEQTPEGFALTLGLGLTLVSFCFIGAISDKNDKNSHWILRWMNFLLPYVRIALKQIKWVFKGIRYVLSILAQFGGDKQFLIHLLFPLALVMAIVSIANRMWLRRMQDMRKEMQRDNMKLSEKIILSKTLMHVLRKKPKSYENYRCSFIFLKCGEETQLFYINQLGQEEYVEGADTLYADLHQLRVKAIHEIMEHHLQFLKKSATDKVRLSFYDGPFDEAVLRSRYRPGSHIYLSNTECHRDRRLCYIDATGRVVFDKNSAAFHQTYQKAAKQQTLASITTEELLTADVVIKFQKTRAENEDLPPFQLGSSYHDYETFTAYRDKQNIQELDAWAANMAFFSAAMGGFFDGLYFYMGAVTLAVFTPQAYMLLLAISVALLVTCMIVRVHEENMFQRRHILTCIQPKLELSRTACKLLMGQQNALLDKSPAAASGDELMTLIAFLEIVSQKRNKTQFEKRAIDKESITENRELATQLLWIELAHEIKTTIELKQKQKNEVRGSQMTAFLAGLFNGLALQGVIASLMFVIVTLFYGTLACPPMFIMGCLALGIMAIIACCVQALLQYETFSKAFDEEDKQFREEYSSVNELQEVLKSGRKGVSDAQLHTMLQETLDYIDSTPFDPSLDYMVVEWCEVWRLFLTGLSKGDKASFELFYNFLKQYDELWFMPVVLFTSAICFSIAFVLQYLAKTFAPSPPNYVDVTAQDKQIPICRYDDEDSVIKASSAPPSALVKNHFLNHRATRGMPRYGSDNNLPTSYQREETSSPFPALVYV